MDCMNIKLIISGGALCATTAIGGLGLAALSQVAHAPQTIDGGQTLASAEIYPEPIIMPLQAADVVADDPALLPDDLQIFFVAARAPNAVATTLAPETSITPRVRLYTPREAAPAATRVTNAVARQPQAQRQQQQTRPVQVVARPSAAAAEIEPNWTVGVYR